MYEKTAIGALALFGFILVAIGIAELTSALLRYMFGDGAPRSNAETCSTVVDIALIPAPKD